MNDKHAKQIKANSAIIDSLSSKNLDMRKEIFEKSKSDFGIFYERFHDRPKSETLPLRKKMFGVNRGVNCCCFIDFNLIKQSKFSDSLLPALH